MVKYEDCSRCRSTLDSKFIRCVVSRQISVSIVTNPTGFSWILIHLKSERLVLVEAESWKTPKRGYENGAKFSSVFLSPQFFHPFSRCWVYVDAV